MDKGFDVNDYLGKIFNGSITIGLSALTDPGLRKEKYIKVKKDDTDFNTVYHLNVEDTGTGWNETARHLSAVCRAVTVSNDLLDDSKEIVEVEEEVDIDNGQEVTQTDLEKATILLTAASINHYNSNHATTGNKLPKYASQMVKQFGVQADNVTEWFYHATHPVSKWKMLKSVGNKTVKRVDGKMKNVSLDKALKIRSTGLPAGCRKLGVIKTAVESMVANGVAAILESPQGVIDAMVDYQTAMQAGTQCHVAARYYGHDKQLVSQDKHEEAYKQCVAYLVAFSPNISILNSPAIANNLAEIVASTQYSRFLAIKKQLQPSVVGDALIDAIREAAKGFAYVVDDNVIASLKACL